MPNRPVHDIIGVGTGLTVGALGAARQRRRRQAQGSNLLPAEQLLHAVLQICQRGDQPSHKLDCATHRQAAAYPSSRSKLSARWSEAS